LINLVCVAFLRIDIYLSSSNQWLSLYLSKHTNSDVLWIL